MSKKSTTFVCTECGYAAAKWLGKCPECTSWNSFEERELEKNFSKGALAVHEKKEARAIAIADVRKDSIIRYDSGMSEFNRVMGGGIVRGSVNLIGGEPGIGKSTLLLRLCQLLLEKGTCKRILYVSGEESESQIADRANRLSVNHPECFLLHETSWEVIKDVLKENKPDLIILDSIQTTICGEIASAPGTVTQIREVTFELMNYCKGKNTTSIIVGHITKDGNIAGPKILEHMVDSVVYFEGDRFGQYRILRSMKNRFGNTNEVGIFEMSAEGLQEVSNPSQYFLEDTLENAFGSAVTCIMEGTRPILIEIQALVVENKFGNGRRTSQGIESNRLAMLLAIIEKYFSLPMGSHDVYANILGGMKLKTNEGDLSIIASIMSSVRAKPIPREIAFIGEVGLTGEVRSVPFIEHRVKELTQLSYKKIFVSASSAKKLGNIGSIEIVGIRTINQLSNYIS